jgi:ferredoxin, 2Fe-2S
MRVRVVDCGGTIHEIEGVPGWTVMEAIRDAGLPMKAECGGCAACATCHVHVAAPWLARLEPAGAGESQMLDELLLHRPESRLACQIVLQVALSGIEVSLTPDCSD